MTPAADAPSPPPPLVPWGSGPAGGVTAESPWPGLTSFTERESDYFHGRDPEAEELLRLIRREGLTVVYGKSGLGKTSLLQAGLMPRLRAQEYLPVYLRIDHSEQGPDPVEQVRRALTTALDAGRIDGPRPDSGSTLWEYFHREGADFWSARNRLLTPVLILDQFEEIFTLGRRSDAARLRARQFVAELVSLLDGRPPPAVAERLEAEPELAETFDPDRRACRVVLALREDFLPEFEALRTRFPTMGNNWFRLEALRGDRALEAVLKPGGDLVEPAAALRIVEFVSTSRRRAAGADAPPALPEELAQRFVQPAYLSVVCRQLNERRLRAGQPRITPDLLLGSRDEIIREFYRQSVADIPAGLREYLEDELLTNAGFRDRAAFDDVVRSCGSSPGAVQAAEAAIRRLIDRRLLHRDEIDGVAWIEFTHDLLCEVVLASRNSRVLRLARERQSRDRRRILLLAGAVGVLAVLFLLTIFFFGLALNFSDREDKALAEARQETEKAKAAEKRSQEMLLRANHLTSLINFDLRDRLQELKDPGPYFSVCTQMVRFFQSYPEAGSSAEGWRDRSVAFNNLGLAYASFTNDVAALTNYSAAVRAVTQAIALDPNQRLYYKDLDICSGNVAKTLGRLGRIDEAVAAYTNATGALAAISLERIPGSLVSSAGTSRDEYFELWFRRQADLFNLFLDRRRYADALAVALEARTNIITHWTNRFPESLSALRAQSEGWEKVGRSHEGLGESRDALAAFLQEAHHAHRFAAVATNALLPSTLDALRVLYVSYHNVGGVLHSRRDWLGCWSNRLESLRYAQRAADLAVTNSLGPLADLASAWHNYALICSDLRRADELSSRAQAVLVQRQLVALDPGNPDRQDSLARYTTAYVGRLLQSSNFVEALRVREADLGALLRETTGGDVGSSFGDASGFAVRLGNIGQLTDLAKAYEHVAEVLVRMDRESVARAIGVRSNALAIQRRARELSRTPTRDLAVATSLRSFGQALLLNGRTGAAREQFEEAFSLGTNVIAQLPEDTDWLDLTAAAARDCGETRLADGLPAEAAAFFERSLDLARQAVLRRPTNGVVLDAYLAATKAVASRWQEYHQPAPAVAAWTNAIGFLERLRTETEPPFARALLQDGSGRAWIGFGEMYELAGDFERVRECLREGTIRQRAALDDLSPEEDNRVNRLGSFAFSFVCAGEYAPAKDAARAALALKPDALWIVQNLGHAHLFLGETDEALRLNREHAGEFDIGIGDAPMSWADAARGDFARFRRLKLVTPEVAETMRRIEEFLPPPAAPQSP